MNNQIYTMFDLLYQDPEIIRLIHIFKRTKKRRIKYKLFNRLFTPCLNEKGIIEIGDIVLMRYDIYSQLTNQIISYQDEISSYKKENNEIL